MEKVKYIVLDFDGTILNSNGDISKELENKLISLQKEGKKIILCSGRSMGGITEVAKKINLDEYKGYIVAYNGSQIYEYQDDKLVQIHDVKFSENQVKEIHNLVGDLAEALVTYCKKSMGVTNMIKRLNKSSKIMGLELDSNYVKETPKIVLFANEDKIKEIKDDVKKILKEYDDTINVFSSVATLIEITPFSASKGEALQKLCDIKGMNYKEMICFGDNGNDISMFEFCKYSVAMGNAIDKIKEISTHKTKTNNENGVFHFLNNNF